MAVPITSIWLLLKGTADAPGLDPVRATVWLGVVCVAIGVFAAMHLDETFDRDLDYYEH